MARSHARHASLVGEPHSRLVGRIVARLVLVLLVASVGSLADLARGAESVRADQPAPASGVWPLQPRPAVVHGFDPPAERWGSGHRGVDLAGHVGQPVRTALAGRVTFAGRLAGRGVVVVDHGDTRTTYEPVTASVHVGDLVAAGDTIGHLALVGSHCFPSACLHWGLIEGRDHYLDPLLLVGAAPVILLPRGPLPAIGRFAPSRSARGVPTAAWADSSGTALAPVRAGSLRAPLVALGWR